MSYCDFQISCFLIKYFARGLTGIFAESAKRGSNDSHTLDYFQHMIPEHMVLLGVD